MTKKRELTIDQLRDVLARQILEIAIQADNPQLKVDVYKATEVRGKVRPAADNPSAAGAMAAFHARVQRAEQQGLNGDGEPAESD